MKSYITSLPVLLPVVCAWAEKLEAEVLAQGAPLTEGELEDARATGVAQPEKIRVVRVETLPQPDNEELMFIARQIGLYSTRSASLSFGHAIILIRSAWEDHYQLVHECVHVSQYERKGGIRPFLHDYLRECFDPGYPFGSLEKEAVFVARHVCHQDLAERPKFAGQS